MNQDLKKSQTNAKLSAQILLTMLSEGADIRTAFDKILGEGAYNKLASDLYDNFNRAD